MSIADSFQHMVVTLIEIARQIAAVGGHLPKTSLTKPLLVISA